MVFFNVNDDTGIQLIHKWFRGLDPQFPNYYTFGSVDDTDDVNDQLGSIDNEFIRKPITWAQTGSNSQYNIDLLTSECIGSYINAEGLVAGSDTGTGSGYSADVSVIATKNEAFFVTVEGELVIEN